MSELLLLAGIIVLAIIASVIIIWDAR